MERESGDELSNAPTLAGGARGVPGRGGADQLVVCVSASLTLIFEDGHGQNGSVCFFRGAGYGDRTRDIQLGKLALYQLS